MTWYFFRPQSSLKSAPYNRSGGVLQKYGFPTLRLTLNCLRTWRELSIVLGSRTANMIEVQATSSMFATVNAVPLSRFEKGKKHKWKEVLVRAHGKYECNSQENLHRCR